MADQDITDYPLPVALFDRVSEPGTPDAGTVVAYVDDADGHLKSKDEDDVVTDLADTSGGGSGGTYSSWTPTLIGSSSNPSLGSTGSISGRYCQNGDLVTAHVIITFGGSGISVGSGAYQITFPVPASTALSNYAHGYGYAYDDSAGALRLVVMGKADSTHLQMFLDGAGTARWGSGGMGRARISPLIRRARRERRPPRTARPPRHLPDLPAPNARRSVPMEGADSPG